MTLFRYVLTISVLFALPGRVAADDRVGAAGLTPPLSVRQMGMGHVSFGGQDMLRAWTNPALLADQATQGEAAVSGASMFGGLQTTGGFGAGAGAVAAGPAWLALSSSRRMATSCRSDASGFSSRYSS